MNRRKSINCFDLDNNQLLHQQIQPIPHFQFYISIQDRQWYLSLNFQPSRPYSYARQASYALSNSPGPIAECTRKAASRIIRLNSFSSFASFAPVAVKSICHSPADCAWLGFQRNTGLRAAAVSSNRETRVVCGAVLTSSGSSSASSAIDFIASTNKLNSSRDSLSVGSIINAPCTTSGKETVYG